MLSLELQIVGYRLDDVLTIVKDTSDGDIEDVFVLQTEHLRLLEGAHAAFGRQHENANTFFAAHGVFSCAASVAAGGTQDVELFSAPCQFVFKEVAEQLHRHVLESQRRAIGQFLQIKAGLKRPQRHDFGTAENLLRIGFSANCF